MLTLSSFYAIATDFRRQLDTIRVLNDHHIAALLIFNVGRLGSMPYLSKEMLALCDELGLPLIVMPSDVSYYSVFKPIINHLLDQQLAKLQNSVEIYETYMNQLVAGSNAYSSMLDTLSRFIRHEIIFFNHNQRYLYSTNKKNRTVLDLRAVNALQEYLGERENDNFQERQWEINGLSFLIIPVTQRDSYYGSMAIENMQLPLTDTDRLAIAQTCKALCISLLSYERMDERLFSETQDFLRDLLIGNIHSLPQINAQAQKLRLNLSGVTGLLLASVFYPEEARQSRENDHKLRWALVEKIRNLLPNDQVVLLEEEQQIAVLTSVPNSAEKYLPTSARIISASFQANYAPVTIAVGPPCVDLGALSECYRKASRAIHISEVLYREPRCITYKAMTISRKTRFQDFGC